MIELEIVSLLDEPLELRRHCLSLRLDPRTTETQLLEDLRDVGAHLKTMSERDKHLYMNKRILKS